MHIGYWYWMVGLGLGLPVALNLVLKWIVVPIRLKGKNAMAISPRREPTLPEKLSPEMREFLGQKVREFRDEGFETVANCNTPNSVDKVDAVELLLVNRESSEVAAVFVVWTVTTRSLVFVVRSHFSDGTMLVTIANPSIGIYPRNPAQDAATIPWATSAKLLLEAHRRRLRRAGRDSQPRVVPEPGRESEYFEEEREQVLDWLVRCGYMWRDEEAGVCRQTWKGAFLTAWKMTNPVKGWRIRRRDRKSRRLWADLGMPLPAAEVDAAGPITPAELQPAEPRHLSPPPLPARASQPLTGGLPSIQYEPRVGRGVHYQRTDDGALEVRIAPLTAADVLLVQCGNLIVMGIMAAALGFYALTAWEQWRISKLIPKYHFHGPGFFVYACTAIFAYDAWKVISALRRSLPTPIVRATPQQLRFANAPGRQRSGQIRRDQIDLIQIVLDQYGIGRKIYRLEARLRGSMALQPLFLSMDRSTLEQVKNALLHALGMTANDPQKDESRAHS